MGGEVSTIATRNKAKVGKHGIVPYCESFLYCESLLFARGKAVNTKKCNSASFECKEWI